ncbi:MAG: hypothetical protein ACR2PG_01880 [Hyphomicrobiaceae bacterium]
MVLNTEPDANAFLSAGYDDVIVATGILPRDIDIPASSDPRVVGCTETLNGSANVGERVLMIGEVGSATTSRLFSRLRGKFDQSDSRIRYDAEAAHGPFGRTLGKSTGWVLRQELRDFGVRQIAGAQRAGELDEKRTMADGARIGNQL